MTARGTDPYYPTPGTDSSRRGGVTVRERFALELAGRLAQSGATPDNAVYLGVLATDALLDELERTRRSPEEALAELKIRSVPEGHVLEGRPAAGTTAVGAISGIPPLPDVSGIEAVAGVPCQPVRHERAPAGFGMAVVSSAGPGGVAVRTEPVYADAYRVIEVREPEGRRLVVARSIDEACAFLDGPVDACDPGPHVDRQSRVLPPGEPVTLDLGGGRTERSVASTVASVGTRPRLVRWV